MQKYAYIKLNKEYVEAINDQWALFKKGFEKKISPCHEMTDFLSGMTIVAALDVSQEVERFALKLDFKNTQNKEWASMVIDYSGCVSNMKGNGCFTNIEENETQWDLINEIMNGFNHLLISACRFVRTTNS